MVWACGNDGPEAGPTLLMIDSACPQTQLVKLSEYIGKKYVILFFYPLDFTFVCPTEITAFSNRYADFEKLNTEILGGVSIDSVYPLVSDVTKSISKSYDVLIPAQL
ncbi:unnamed protein product [Ilex paraguariensis]|uniref:Alkyl hydroperoxide reductase subunit C/ Thiol specific antioxidant domain-containing protein n=1 Tax=Ilex paraguariensis TaxID=185542 RepID=A0ABC8UHT1_9AQUA